MPIPDAAPVRGRRAYLADRADGARRHAGVDLGAPPGSPVLAPEAGEVIAAARSTPAPPGAAAWPANAPWRGYGPAVVYLRGESGRFHLLSHLAWPLHVDVGDRVAVGDVVGEVSHLAHAHWEVRTRERIRASEETSDFTLDPLAWLRGQDVGPRAMPVEDIIETRPPALDVMTLPSRAPARDAQNVGLFALALFVAWAVTRKG